jgi:hypothetical protein
VQDGTAGDVLRESVGIEFGFQLPWPGFFMQSWNLEPQVNPAPSISTLPLALNHSR